MYSIILICSQKNECINSDTRTLTTLLFFFFFFFFLLEMFIQHTAFLLDKGSQHRRRGILPPAVSIYLMNETRRKPTL